MKKCASCTKDLPDAALHCVFCGGKQAPSPAASPAKTVMGYVGSAELEALRAQAAAHPAQPASSPTAASPYGAPHPGSPQPPPGGYGTPGGYPPPGGGHAPYNVGNAATMFVPPGSGPGPGPMGPAPMGGPMGGPMLPAPGHGPAGAYNMPGPAPMAPARVAPIQPVASPPYLASQTAARAGRPIEPWQDSLRLMMFIWGALLLAAFATPLTTDPLTFHWDAILDAEGKAKLPSLIIAAIGLLSIVVAAIPMAAGARGTIAMLLGLAGIFVTSFVLDMWGLQLVVAQLLVAMIGMVIVIPSLLARDEYRDAALPRILVTVCVIAALHLYVVPRNGTLPLVELFKAAIEAPGASKIFSILVLGHIMLLVLSLLAWLPSPSSGGAKTLAWLLILWPLVMHAASLFIAGDPSMVENTPYQGIMSWIAGASTGGGLGVAYLAITGYGMATVLGKQLE